jgi:predicted nucleic acid-binding protein
MIILDTNVLSELMKSSPATLVFEWVAKQPSMELFTTSITETEILYGIELLTHGKRRQELLRAAEEMFNEDLGGRVLRFGSEAAGSFAEIAAHRRALGKPISHADAQIAAIARLTGAKLATRNLNDFADCGLNLVNPWDGESA